MKIPSPSRWLITMVISIIFIYILCAVAMQVFLKDAVEPAYESFRLTIESRRAEVLADLQALDAAPIFPDATFTADAASYLRVHLPWPGRVKSPPEFVASSPALEAIVNDKINQLKGSLDLDRLAKDKRLDSDLGLSWIDELEKFDHWRLLNDPDFAKSIHDAGEASDFGRLEVLAKMPYPNYVQLRDWTFVRALQLGRTHEGDRAMRLVRHVAQLTHSSGTLIGAMVVVSTLSREDQLAKLVSAKQFTPLPQNLILVYKRLNWAWDGLLRSPLVFDHFPTEFEPFLKRQNGACAAATGHPLPLQGFQSALEYPWPLEPDMTASLAESRRILAAAFKVCDLGAYEPLLRPAKNPVYAREDWYLRVPIVRSIVVGILDTIATPNYFRLYEKE